MSWPPDYAIRIAYDRPTTDLRRYFDEEAHSDLVIHCGEDRIHVQKKILQTWSEHFKELLKSSPHAGDGPLVLEGDDPATLRALIKYMYGVPYIAHSPYQQHNESTFIGEFFNPEDEDARKLNDLYKIAHKYCVWSLEWDILITFSEYIELGYSGGNFYKAIELAYQMSESDHWLYAYIERACKHNIKRLVEDTEFFDMLKRTPQLSVELLAHVVGKLDHKGDPRHEGLRLRCPDCRQFFTLHKSHVPDNEWICGWCRYRAPAGGHWDEYS